MTQSPHPESDWSPVAVDGARSRLVQSAEGRGYRISLFIPASPPPPEGFPVLVVLDGVALFPTLVESVRRLSHRSEATGVVPTVVVGVGHAGPGLYDPAQRHRDFTPGPPVNDEAAARFETGGADRFLGFLTGTVLPLIRESTPVDPARTALLGHSLAGYFALHAFTQTPDAFAAYGAVSPSLWWDPARIQQGLARVSDRANPILLAVGAREQSPGDADARRSERRMVDAVRETGARLGAAPGHPSRQVFVLEDEDHGSVVAPAAVRFLRLIGSRG